MMQTLIALVIVAAAVSTSARPPGPTYAPPPSLGLMGHSRVRSTLMPNDRVNGYLIPRFLLPRYLAYEERAPILPPASEDDWLNKEIYRINQMDEEPPINVYEADVTHWLARDLYLKHMIEGFNNVQTPRQYSQQNIQPGFDQRYMEPDGIKKRPYDLDREDPRPTFALTPGQKGYYDVSSPTNSTGSPAVPVPLEGEEPRAAMILEPPRKTRQNPNLSRQKNLLGPDLAKLKAGLANKDYRLPVSLLPSNLRWLKINQPGDDDER